MVDLCAWQLNVGLNRESSSQKPTHDATVSLPPTFLCLLFRHQQKLFQTHKQKNRLKNHPRGFPTWRAVGWNKQELLVGISVTLFPIESLSTPLKNVFTLNDPLPSSPLPYLRCQVNQSMRHLAEQIFTKSKNGRLGSPRNILGLLEHQSLGLEGFAMTCTRYALFRSTSLVRLSLYH